MARFQELYKEKKNIKLVNAAIYAKAYTDESILLKDLINPAQSILPQNKKFIALCTKWDVNLQTFSDNFQTKIYLTNQIVVLVHLNKKRK